MGGVTAKGLGEFDPFEEYGNDNVLAEEVIPNWQSGQSISGNERVGTANGNDNKIGEALEAIWESYGDENMPDQNNVTQNIEEEKTPDTLISIKKNEIITRTKNKILIIENENNKKDALVTFRKLYPEYIKDYINTITGRIEGDVEKISEEIVDKILVHLKSQENKNSLFYALSEVEDTTALINYIKGEGKRSQAGDLPLIAVEKVEGEVSPEEDVVLLVTDGISSWYYKDEEGGGLTDEYSEQNLAPIGNSPKSPSFGATNLQKYKIKTTLAEKVLQIQTSKNTEQEKKSQIRDLSTQYQSDLGLSESSSLAIVSNHIHTSNHLRLAQALDKNPNLGKNLVNENGTLNEQALNDFVDYAYSDENRISLVDIVDDIHKEFTDPQLQEIPSIQSVTATSQNPDRAEQDDLDRKTFRNLGINERMSLKQVKALKDIDGGAMLLNDIRNQQNTAELINGDLVIINGRTKVRTVIPGDTKDQNTSIRISIQNDLGSRFVDVPIRDIEKRTEDLILTNQFFELGLNRLRQRQDFSQDNIDYASRIMRTILLSQSQRESSNNGSADEMADKLKEKEGFIDILFGKKFLNKNTDIADRIPMLEESGVLQNGKLKSMLELRNCKFLEVEKWLETRVNRFPTKKEAVIALYLESDLHDSDFVQNYLDSPRNKKLKKELIGKRKA